MSRILPTSLVFRRGYVNKGKVLHCLILYYNCPLYLFLGYGDFYPTSTFGKAICVVYAIFGIPITLLLLRLIGQFILRGQWCFITAVEKGCLGRTGSPSRLNEKCFFFGLIYLFAVLIIAAATQMWAEEWSYGESLYSSSPSLLLDLEICCRQTSTSLCLLSSWG